jgi:hypothetical protein
MNQRKPFFPLRSNQKGFSHVEFFIAIVFIVVIGGVGIRVIRDSHAATTTTSSNCTVNSMLVNSCRPWLGAAVEGYPQAANTRTAQFLYAEKRMVAISTFFMTTTPPGVCHLTVMSCILLVSLTSTSMSTGSRLATGRTLVVVMRPLTPV